MSQTEQTSQQKTHNHHTDTQDSFWKTKEIERAILSNSREERNFTFKKET